MPKTTRPRCFDCGYAKLRTTKTKEGIFDKCGECGKESFRTKIEDTFIHVWMTIEVTNPSGFFYLLRYMQTKGDGKEKFKAYEIYSKGIEINFKDLVCDALNDNLFSGKYDIDEVNSDE